MKDFYKAMGDDNLIQSEEDALAEVTCKFMIIKLQTITNKLHNSDMKKKFYEGHCKHFHLKKLQLQIDVPTRWNSTLHMIQCCVKQCKAIDSWLDTNPDVRKYYLQNFKLNGAEWEKID